jgi:ribonuclease HI
MIITVFTDASFYWRQKVAAYACWAKADGKTVRISGVAKEQLTSANHAEMAAFANGIFLAVRSFAPKVGDRIIIQTDCQDAMSAFGLHPKIKRRKPLEAYQQKTVDFVSAEVERCGFKIEARYVKAHNGTGDKRSAVNEWCDAAAKKAARDQLAKLKYEELAK